MTCLCHFSAVNTILTESLALVTNSNTTARMPVPEHGCRQNQESCKEDKEHLAEHPTLTERPFLRRLRFLRESGCFTRLAGGACRSGGAACLDDAYLFLSESH